MLTMYAELTGRYCRTREIDDPQHLRVFPKKKSSSINTCSDHGGYAFWWDWGIMSSIQGILNMFWYHQPYDTVIYILHKQAQESPEIFFTLTHFGRIIVWTPSMLAWDLAL